MFKAGQTVEVVTDQDWSEGFQNGCIITLERVIPHGEVFAGEWEARASNGATGIIAEKNFRAAPIGPVVTETVTKTRIVPGVYDAAVQVNEWHESDRKVVLTFHGRLYDADQLDAAAAVLSALAKGLRDA